MGVRKQQSLFIKIFSYLNITTIFMLFQIYSNDIVNYRSKQSLCDLMLYLNE